MFLEAFADFVDFGSFGVLPCLLLEPFGLLLILVGAFVGGFMPPFPLQTIDKVPSVLHS